MSKRRVIAKCDLNTAPHSWTKGLDYELVEEDGGSSWHQTKDRLVIPMF